MVYDVDWRYAASRTFAFERDADADSATRKIRCGIGLDDTAKNSGYRVWTVKGDVSVGGAAGREETPRVRSNEENG